MLKQASVSDAVTERLAGVSDPNRTFIGTSNFSFDRSRLDGAAWKGGNVLIAPAAGVSVNFGVSKGNIVFVGKVGRCDIKISIRGSGNFAYIADTRNMRSAIDLTGDNNLFFSGAGATANGARISVHGSGVSAVIGDDCMFANGVIIRTSDMHPIYDLDTGQQTNQPASTLLHPHVWLGQNAQVLKGVTIGAGAIVAAEALVVADVHPFTVVGGTPAKLLQERKTWLRNNKNATAELAALKQKLEA